MHDPYVKHWWEFEKQESYPAPGHSWSRFFRNQDKLSDLRMAEDLPAALKGADAVVLAVRHSPYLALTPREVLDMTGRPVAVIDCFAFWQMIRSASISRMAARSRAWAAATSSG